MEVAKQAVPHGHSGYFSRSADAIAQFFGMRDDAEGLEQALIEQVEEVRADLAAAGCPQQDVDRLDEIEVSADLYATQLAQFRVLRLQALLDCQKGGAAVLSALAESDLELCKQPDRAQKRLKDLETSEDLNEPVLKAQILRLVQGSWIADASAALEQLEVQRVVRVLVPFVLICGLGLQFIQHFMAWFEERTAETSWTLVGDGFAAVVAFLSSPFVMCCFFGLLGAILSIWFDSDYIPRTPHWRLVRRSERYTRCWGGVFVGWMVAALAPVLFGAFLISGETGGSAGNAEGIIRMYFFALIFGFSQDAFVKRVRTFQPGEPAAGAR